MFVFSSLLAQRQFTAADLALDAINHPDATDNFRTALSVEQALFDRTTSAKIRAASIGQAMAATGRQLVDHDLMAAVTDAFGGVLVAAATVRSAAAAAETARADRELAGNRRDAGRVTDADVLQLDVYLARTLEQQVQAASDERIARARLNQSMGEPLLTMFSLDPTPPAIAIDITNPAALEEEAVKNRRSRARHAAGAAGGRGGGRGAGGVPALRGRAGRVGTERRRLEFAIVELGGWRGRPDHLFHGLADKARLAEAREQARRRAIEKGKPRPGAARCADRDRRLEAARASEAVGRAAADQARESRRIIRDRYESGLTDAAMLLRAADAVQQPDTQQIAARVNVLTATATFNER